jgi:hypothetical protein
MSADNETTSGYAPAGRPPQPSPLIPRVRVARRVHEVIVDRCLIDKLAKLDLWSPQYHATG